MYVIEHALLNLIKNKGRNILQGAIILVIITAAVVALAIYNTSGYIMDDTRMALQCAVRVAPRLQTPSGGGGARPVMSGNPQNAANDPQTAADGNTTPEDGNLTVADSRQEAALTPDQYQSFAESAYLDGSDIKGDGRDADGVDAIYYLKQPDMLAAFEAELRIKGLPDDYVVRTDESAFERIIGPAESLNKLSLTFLIIVLVLGAIIMALLSAIAIRERKYEIGVLRAMGMKKRSVALSLWTEITAVAVICFALGIAAGSALSQPVSDSLTAWRARPAAAQSSSLADRLNEGEAEQAEKLDITMNGTTVLEIFGITILLASITGLVSVSRITKSEPIKILMERN